jgi:hypothetical protein
LRPRTLELPGNRIWLRVAGPGWIHPLDPGFARHHGGRWNPPGSFPTLYLNADPVVARPASVPDGRGGELAWFPATSGSHAHPVWDQPLELGAWRDAVHWTDLDLPEPPELG